MHWEIGKFLLMQICAHILEKVEMYSAEISHEFSACSMNQLNFPTLAKSIECFNKTTFPSITQKCFVNWIWIFIGANSSWQFNIHGRKVNKFIFHGLWYLFIAIDIQLHIVNNMAKPQQHWRLLWTSPHLVKKDHRFCPIRQRQRIPNADLGWVVLRMGKSHAQRVRWPHAQRVRRPYAQIGETLHCTTGQFWGQCDFCH